MSDKSDKQKLDTLKHLLATASFPLALFLQIELEKCGWDIEQCDEATKYLLTRFIEIMELIKEDD